MIIGLGLDLVDIDRVATAIKRDADCAAAWCSKAELSQLDVRASLTRVLAGRIAAKEAVAKAIGTGFAGDVTWQDVEITHDKYGRPIVQLSGGAFEAAKILGVSAVLVSITHTDKTAGACAVALGWSRPET